MASISFLFSHISSILRQWHFGSNQGEFHHWRMQRWGYPVQKGRWSVHECRRELPAKCGHSGGKGGTSGHFWSPSNMFFASLIFVATQSQPGNHITILETLLREITRVWWNRQKTTENICKASTPTWLDLRTLSLPFKNSSVVTCTVHLWRKK